MAGRGLLSSFLLCSIITACGGRFPIRPCDDVTLAASRSLMGKPFTISALTAKVETIHGLAPESISVLTVEESMTLPLSNDQRYKVGDQYLSWSLDGASHGLLVRDDWVKIASVVFTRRLPPVGQAIQCLGLPEHYWAFYPVGPSNQVALLLLYESQGITVVATGHAVGSQQPPRWSDSTVEQIQAVPPTPTETLPLRMLETIIPSSARRAVDERLPWPRTWEDIVIAPPGQ
jgi:hypothetical protein